MHSPASPDSPDSPALLPEPSPIMETGTVLFVEDEADNRLVLLHAFRRRFRCLAVADAHEALAVLEREPVTVLVTDQRMAGLSGVDLCERVRAQWPDVRRIVLTADAERASVVDAINRGGVHAFLDKPWQFETLDLLLRAHVSEVRAERSDVALRAALLEHERLETAAALRGALLHDLASATGVADLGYDAICDGVAELEAAHGEGAVVDLRQGLEALREGLDTIGRLQGALRQAAQDHRRHVGVLHVDTLMAQVRRLLGRRHGRHYRVTVPPALWVIADHLAVARILLNVLRNAIEASEEADGVRLWVSALAEGDVVAIAVEDGGPGVDDELRARIFDRGFTTRAAGTGLGLALSRDLARREGGDLALEPSQHLSGCRFVLRLPRAEAPAINP